MQIRNHKIITLVPNLIINKELGIKITTLRRQSVSIMQLVQALSDDYYYSDLSKAEWF